MIDWFYLAALYFNTASGLAILVAGFAGRKPHNFMAISLGITETLLLVQFAVTTVLVAQGITSARDIVEFYAYVITALLIPVGAVLWALVDRESKWSTAVMGVAALSIAVMLVRMHQIWTGNFNL